MKVEPSDPTVETIVNKVRNNLWDLQPDFQRGEVWSLPKKQRLIDSILRGWHIPPIHTIKVKDTGKYEVLDGQQRLSSIRDFCKGKFVIDGRQEPSDSRISSLDGMTYEELSERQRLEFDDFTIRVLTITDYEPEEPGELFYRLNQPANLTAAEQRNAFYGNARSQIKSLSLLMTEAGLGADTIGFSNGRMAYDDVLARVATTLDKGTLNLKLTANVVTEKYRSPKGFEPNNVERLLGAVEFLSGLVTSQRFSKIKLNKSTLYSWLCVFVKYLDLGGDRSALGDCFVDFEILRLRRGGSLGETDLFGGYIDLSVQKHLIEIYSDRASSRVGDVSSVILRDIISWAFIETRMGGIAGGGLSAICGELRGQLWGRKELEDLLLKGASSIEWGVRI